MSLVQCIQDQGLYYRKLTTELANEARIGIELNNTKHERQQLDDAIRTKKVEIHALEENSKKEYNHVRKLRHLSFKSAAATLSGKKKELIAKEETKYQLAFENEQRSKRDLDYLETQFQNAVTKEEQLTRQKNHFDDIRHQFTSLLEQIFAIENFTSFPLESQLKAEIRNYEEQRRLAKRDKNRFTEAEKTLSNCMSDTKKVIRLLDTVVNYVPFDLFGGRIIDEEQLAYLDAAKRRIWEIQRLLNVARTVLPEIPYPQTLDVVTNNTLLSMQINLNYIDVAWKAKTTQCFGMLDTAYQNMQNSLTWIKRYLDYTTGAIHRLNDAVISTQKRLENERKRIMDSVLAGHMDGGGGTGESSAVFEPPPPVYEAPLAESSTTQTQDDLPVIPNDMTPLPPNLPEGESPPWTPVSSTVAETNNASNRLSLSHPITPIFSDTNPNSLPNASNHPIANNQQAYLSQNVNNPFNQQM